MITHSHTGLVHTIKLAYATHLKWPNLRCSKFSWIGGPKKVNGSDIIRHTDEDTLSLAHGALLRYTGINGSHKSSNTGGYLAQW